MNVRLFSKLLYSVIILCIIICVGTFGYMFFEEWNLVDSFYQTIITVSTVGFGEVHVLSDIGKLFTAFLIITSFGTFAFAITSITSYVVSGEYLTYFKESKLMKEIEGINDHVIVCGFGRVGSKAIETLREHHHKFLVIEQNDEIIEHFRTKANIYCLKGNATQDDMLLKAGIQKAKALITTLPYDADNLFVVLTARELNNDLTIISRASKSSSVKKLKIAGADNVIMPDSIGGSHMAQLVATPDVLEFIDEISVQGENEINLEKIDFKDIPENCQFKRLKDLKDKFPVCNIIGFKTPDNQYIINPSDNTEIVPKSKLFILGNPDQIKELNRILGI